MHYNYNNPKQPNTWNIVTKEAADKTIIDFDRDFVITEPMACNGGKVLRVAQAKDETFLIIAEKNPGEEDDANIRILFNVYQLKKSGNLVGSDYIFSLVDTVIGESRGCGVEKLVDKDIVGVIHEIIIIR